MSDIQRQQLWLTLRELGQLDYSHDRLPVESTRGLQRRVALLGGMFAPILKHTMKNH